MGIYYRANMIRLEATRQGTWVASVTPVRPAGQPLSSGPGAGDMVGEFERREEAIAAAQAHIDGTAIAPAGETAHRSREAEGMLPRLPTNPSDPPPGSDRAEPRQDAGEVGALGGVPHEILVIDDDKLTRWSLMKVLGPGGLPGAGGGFGGGGAGAGGRRPAGSGPAGRPVARWGWGQRPPGIPAVAPRSPRGDDERGRHPRDRPAPARSGSQRLPAKPCTAMLLLTLVASLL